MNKERLVQIARKVFGESAILPFDELQLLSKAIRNEALEEAARYCHDQSIPQQDEIHSDSQWAAAVLAIGIRNMKEQL